MTQPHFQSVDFQITTNIKDARNDKIRSQYLEWVHWYDLELRGLFKTFQKACKVFQVPLFLDFSDFVSWVYHNTEKVWNPKTRKHERLLED